MNMRTYTLHFFNVLIKKKRLGVEAQAFILAVGKLRHKNLCELQVDWITKRETYLRKKKYVSLAKHIKLLWPSLMT